jgi:FkbM family methyltransferase
MTRSVRAELWVAWSLAVIATGAFGPWTTGNDVLINGIADEIAGIVAGIAAVALLLYHLMPNRRVAALLLLGGAITTVIAVGDASDPAGPFGGPGPNVHPSWGLWTALVGSISLVLASVVLFRRSHAHDGALDARARYYARLLDPRLLAPSRDGLLRAAQARTAERAAETARRAAKDAAAREKAFRAEFASLAGRLTPYLSVELGGSVYLLPAQQKFGTGRFASLDWKEHRHLERAIELLKERKIDVHGTTFVDVGANVGTTIVHALQRFGFASGCAIEPEPANLRLLRANLAVNSLADSIDVVEAAVSDRPGEGELVLRPLSGGKHHLASGKRAHSGSLSVPLVTLDMLARDGVLEPASVGLAWFDIQGHELEALRGATTLLDRSVPLVFELDTRELDDARSDELNALLGEHYTHVADLSLPNRERGLVPLDELDGIAHRHAGTFTDLLVVRS